MAGQTTSWSVEYPDTPAGKLFEQAFQRLQWDQQFTTTNGVCMHTFGGADMSNGSDSVMVALRRAVEQLANLAEFNFRVVEQSDEERASTIQHHSILSSSFMDGKDVPPTLTIWTRPRIIAMMQKDARNRAHVIRGGMDSLVSTIAGEYGASVKAQECAVIPEFQRLRQINLTDWEFILSSIIPRSMTPAGAAGFEFYSVDGSDARFNNLDHVADTYAAEPRALRRHQVMGDAWSVVQSGGDNMTVTGMSDDRKQMLVAGSSGGPKPSISGRRFAYCPYQTQAAVRAAAATRHWHFISRAGQHLLQQIGDVGMMHPAKVTLRGSSIGTATSILHLIQGAAYVQHITLQTMNPIAVSDT